MRRVWIKVPYCHYWLVVGDDCCEWKLMIVVDLVCSCHVFVLIEENVDIDGRVPSILFILMLLLLTILGNGCLSTSRGKERRCCDVYKPTQLSETTFSLTHSRATPLFLLFRDDHTIPHSETCAEARSLKNLLCLYILELKLNTRKRSPTPFFLLAKIFFSTKSL